MLAIDWHWHVTTDLDVGVDDDDVDIDLVLAHVYLDVHLVFNLTYVGLDSIWSPGFTLQVDFDSIQNIFFQMFLNFKIQNFFSWWSLNAITLKIFFKVNLNANSDHFTYDRKYFILLFRILNQLVIT